MKIIIKNLEIKYQVFQEFVQKFSFMGKRKYFRKFRFPEKLDFMFQLKHSLNL